MTLAKMTSTGQITIPDEIRKKLGMREGDNILFLEEGNKIVIQNSSVAALERFQERMAGEAEKAELTTDEEIIAFCKEVRKEVFASTYENNA